MVQRMIVGRAPRVRQAGLGAGRWGRDRGLPRERFAQSWWRVGPEGWD